MNHGDENSPGTPAPATGPVKNEEAAQLAREKGWVQPQPYNYESIIPQNVPATGEDAMNDANWGHNGAKYEWKEEYGEVGPAIPALEAQLYHAPNQQTIGDRFDK